MKRLSLAFAFAMAFIHAGCGAEEHGRHRLAELAN
jgi:hypothetical protein